MGESVGIGLCVGAVVIDVRDVARQRIWSIWTKASVTLEPYLISDGKGEDCPGYWRWRMSSAICLKYVSLETWGKGKNLGIHSSVTVLHVALVEGRYHL